MFIYGYVYVAIKPAVYAIPITLVVKPLPLPRQQVVRFEGLCLGYKHQPQRSETWLFRVRHWKNTQKLFQMLGNPVGEPCALTNETHRPQRDVKFWGLRST